MSILMLSACGGGGQSATPQTTPSVIPAATAMPTATASPVASVDYRPTIAQLEQYIQAQMQQQQLVGLSIALVDDQRVVWSEGFGYANAANKAPVNAETLFRAGSISKLFTATALMQQVEQGKTTVEQSLNSVLPELHVQSRFHVNQASADADVSLARVLSHQAGLPSEYLSGIKAGSITLKQLPASVNGVWLSNQPGSMYAYSNFGFTLLGAAVERLSGQPFSEQIRSRLLRPLNMLHSDFNTPQGSNLSIASGHLAGQAIGTQPEYDNEPEGGLWTSANELSHFAQMLFADGTFNGQAIVRPETLGKMKTAQFANNPFQPDCRIGLAWFLNECGTPIIGGGVKVMQHSGSTVAFNSQLTVLPEHKLAVIVLANSDTGVGVVSQLAAHAARLMLHAKTGKTVSEPTLPVSSLVPPTASDLAQYPGLYLPETAEFTIKPVQIINDGKELILQQGETILSLFRDQDGWLRPAVNLNLPFRIQLRQVNGVKVLFGQSSVGTQMLATRVDPVPISAEWLAMQGQYSVSNPEQNTRQTLELIENNGYLVLMNQAEVVRLLTPINAQQAVTSGLGRGLGDTLERTATGMKGLGFTFTKLAPQAGQKR